MLVHVREVLTAAELRQARAILADAPWGDGRMTAGEQSAMAKNNRQLPETCEATLQLQRMVLTGLQRNQVHRSFKGPLCRHSQVMLGLERLELGPSAAAQPCACRSWARC